MSHRTTGFRVDQRYRQCNPGNDPSTESRRGPTDPRARHIVDRELSASLPTGALYDVKLLVSELVTNGIRHGRCGPGDVITLELVTDGCVRCVVIDHGPGILAAPGGGTVGWGWRLVEQLAVRWGFTRSGNGTQVWFETSVPHRSPAFEPAA